MSDFGEYEPEPPVQFLNQQKRTNRKSSSTQEPTSEDKINELLLRVKRIDSSVLRLIQTTRPQPKQRSVWSSLTDDTHVPGGSLPYLPPRPLNPQPSESREKANKKILSTNDCAFLVAQIENIKQFVDTMIDDEFDGKKNVMMSIEAVAKVLTL